MRSLRDAKWFRSSIVGGFVLGLVVAACTGADSAPKAPAAGTLEARVAKLEQDLADLKLVLKVAARMDVDEVIPQVKAQMENENKVHQIPEMDSPVSGPANAKVTIVEFSDFQCPYCFQRAQIVKDIQAKYPGQVRVIFKHFPLSFHTAAPAAHASAMAAQKQGKFWEYRYALAGSFKDLSPANMKAAAKAVGLDMAKFEKDMALDPTKQAAIDRDMQLGSQVGVRGTPTFFVNGKLSQGFDVATIDKLLAQ